VPSRPALARWAVAVLSGGLLCTLGDQLHVEAEVLYYPHPDLWGQAWWVFPLMAAATFAGLVTARLVDPSPRPFQNPRYTAAANLLFFPMAYASSAFVEGRATLAAVLVVLLLPSLVREMPPRRLLFCAVVAACGTGWEMTWSRLGMFTYDRPDMLGVPFWLPLLYAHAALAADSARRIIDGNPANPP
jgi:hypothetical protein